MDKPIRRTSHLASLMLGAVLGVWLNAPSAAEAVGALDALSSKDAADGLRAALSQGVGKAVTQLGAKNGFLNDPKVAIPLPPTLEKADHALRMVGMSGQADELHATMNHAAEQAVAQARPVFEGALPARSSLRNSNRLVRLRPRNCRWRKSTIISPAKRRSSG